MMKLNLLILLATQIFLQIENSILGQNFLGRNYMRMALALGMTIRPLKNIKISSKERSLILIRFNVHLNDMVMA